MFRKLNKEKAWQEVNKPAPKIKILHMDLYSKKIKMV